MAKLVKCANPDCNERVRTYEIKRNRFKNRTLYCSSSCYSAFPPSMLRACGVLKIEPPDRYLLKVALEAMMRSLTHEEIGSAVGVSRKSVRPMATKLGITYGRDSSAKERTLKRGE